MLRVHERWFQTKQRRKSRNRNRSKNQTWFTPKGHRRQRRRCGLKQTNNIGKTQSEAPNKEEDHRANRDMNDDRDRYTTQGPWAMWRNGGGQTGRRRTTLDDDVRSEYGDDAERLQISHGERRRQNNAGEEDEKTWTNRDNKRRSNRSNRDTTGTRINARRQMMSNQQRRQQRWPEWPNNERPRAAK